MILHEFAKIWQIQKCATQMHECRNIRKIRLELRNSYDVNRESSIFLLNINQLQGLSEAYLTPSLKKLDKIWTKIAKRGDLNALQTSSEFNLYTMSHEISSAQRQVFFPSIAPPPLQLELAYTYCKVLIYNKIPARLKSKISLAGKSAF